MSSIKGETNISPDSAHPRCCHLLSLGSAPGAREGREPTPWGSCWEDLGDLRSDKFVIHISIRISRDQGSMKYPYKSNDLLI